MERYSKPLEQTIRYDGSRVYKTCRPTAIKQTTRDIVVSANERDRYDILGSKIYGSTKHWWKIASVNGNVNGSLHIKPGANLIIPTE